jgi:hypothetical protein
VFLWVQLGDRYNSWCKLGTISRGMQDQRREREEATWQYQGEPNQQANVMWHSLIGPSQHKWASPWHNPIRNGPRMCHVELIHRSTSTTMERHTSIRASWQDVTGAQQKEECQMTALREATSLKVCHMAASHWSTSLLWAPPWYKVN